MNPETFNPMQLSRLPDIDNAFDNIKKACDKKLAKLYPVDTPIDIVSRYEKELALIKKTRTETTFELFRLLSVEAATCKTHIICGGTLAGSFVYFLLSNNSFNPLPVHYYCPICGYYEFVKTRLFGIDLPEKKCPGCGDSLFADGYNLSIESVWGNDGKRFPHLYNHEKEGTSEYWYYNPFHVSFRFLPIARKLFLTSLFPDLKLCPEVVDAYVADNTTQLGRFASSLLYSHKRLDRVDDLQQRAGICINDVPIKELRNFTGEDIYYLTPIERISEVSTKAMTGSIVDNLFSELHPETFRDMVSLLSAALSTFSWEDSVEKNADSLATVIYSRFFKHYPCFTKEDFFDFLLDEGIERSLAFEISEKIRLGYASSPKYGRKFHTLPLSDELKVVARNYLYIFPRAHCVEYILTCAWITYLNLAP